MSLSSLASGSIETKAARIDSISTTAILTGLNVGKATVLSIHIANIDSVARSITVEYYNKIANAAYKIQPQISVAANNRLVIDDIPIFLRTDDEIRVTATTADVFDVIITSLVNLGGVQQQ